VTLIASLVDFQQALHTIKGPFNKSPLERVTLLRDLTGYLMPGTLTLVMGMLVCNLLKLF
jgi:hypothetical protein